MSTVISGYFDRSTYPLIVLCLAHGEARWGDPFEGDEAYNARYTDPSGDWCWAPNVGAPCSECGS